MWQQVTSGEGSTSLANLPDYEDSIAEGQRGMLLLNLRITPSSNIIETLEDKLEAVGVKADLQTSGKTVSIVYKKGFPWLAIIVAAVLGLIILAILIVSWKFFKDVAAIVPQPLLIVAIIAGIALVAVITYILARRKVPAIAEGGRV